MHLLQFDELLATSCFFFWSYYDLFCILCHFVLLLSMEFDPLYQPPLDYFSWYHVTASIFRIANYLGGKNTSNYLGNIKFPTLSDFLTILTNWLFAFFSWVQNPDSRSFKVSLWISFSKTNPKLTSFFRKVFSSHLKTHKKGKFEGCCSVWQIWKATGGFSLSGRLLLLMLCAITLTTEKGAVVTQRLRAGFTKFKKFT